MATSRGIFSGCAIVAVGLVIVLAVACGIPATQVNSFERFIMVGSATVIPYAFGVMVGVSAVYYSRRRGRFIVVSGACALVVLVAMLLFSGRESIFSLHARGIEKHLGEAVTAVWGFLPLVGLVFGSLAVAVGRRGDGPTSA